MQLSSLSLFVHYITGITQERLCKCNKVLVYAPGNRDGELIMKPILVELGLTYSSLDNNPGSINSIENTSNEQDFLNVSPWILLPMATPQSELEEELDSVGNSDVSLPTNSRHIIIDVDAPDDERQRDEELSITKSKCERDQELSVTKSKLKSDLQISDLGSMLADALAKVRKIQPHDPIVFLGMDSPELPLDEIALAMKAASNGVGKAYMNPAADGGYGMLCVPKQAPVGIFERVRWSSSLTAVSQMKALSDNGVDTIVGSLMNDIDEPDDVKYLAIRLCMLYTETKRKQSQILTSHRDRLFFRSEVLPGAKGGESGSIDRPSKEAQCSHTLQALQELGLINRREQKQRLLYTINASKWLS